MCKWEPTCKFGDDKTRGCLVNMNHSYHVAIESTASYPCSNVPIQFSHPHKVRTCHLEILHEGSFHTKTQKPTSISQYKPLSWQVSDFELSLPVGYEEDLGEALESDH